MPKLHANMYLSFDLDEQWGTKLAQQEIKRSFAYLAGSIEITTHPSPDAERLPENTLRLSVSLHAPYWSNETDEEKADINWDAMLPWLKDKLTKVDQALMRYNGDRGGARVRPLDITWLELSFRGHLVIAIRLDAHSRLPEQALTWIDSLRQSDMLNEIAKAQDSEISCIRIPSRESIDAQIAEPLAAQREAAAQIEEEPEAEAELNLPESANDSIPSEEITYYDTLSTESDSSEDTLEQDHTPNDELDASEANDIYEESDLEEETLSPMEKAVHEPLPERTPDIAIDYSLWGIEFSNGTIREIQPEEL